MKRILIPLEIIDNINEWVGRIFSVAILALTFVIAYEVIMRKFFARPSIWTYDVSKQIYALHFLIVAGYTLLHKGHVGIDVITKKLSKRTRTILDAICYLILFFPFWFVMLWFGVKFAAMSWQLREIGRDIFSIPLYPIKTVIPLSVLLILLQGFSAFFRKLLIIKRGDQIDG